MSDVYVTVSGPLFDGRADAALQRGIIAARHDVAAAGARLTQAAFGGSIRRPTGRFLASVKTIDDTHVFETHSGSKTYSMTIAVDQSSETLVTSDIATYGPWLEGTGSRNLTTRFKGYHGFRKAGLELDRIAADIAKVALEPYVREMN